MRSNDTAMASQGESGLTEAQASHCVRMHDHLSREIAAAGGWLSFERFMDAALYAPGLGYYSAGAHKLGEGGDFTTAPEISPLFGACVARQCAEILGALGGGSILEIGAGSGRLAADILSRLETLGHLPACYWILEISADLRDRQRALIARRVPHLQDRVRWLDQAPGEPFDGVIVANEVLDALPITRFRRLGRQVQEMGVICDADRFAWEPRQASPAVAAECARLAGAAQGAGLAGAAEGALARAEEGAGLARAEEGAGLAGAAEGAGLAGAAGEWPDGYTSEYCPRLAAWTRSVTHCLNAGAVLWFDYGLPRPQYYLPERREGTLRCHFRQRAHGDPLIYPGLQDITAWVDYTRLAEASRPGGFTLAGFTTQAHFLAGLGIDEEMRAIAAGDAHQFARLAGQARRLMLPGDMGESFKAMAWLRGLELPLSGFALQDLRHTL